MNNNVDMTPDSETTCAERLAYACVFLGFLLVTACVLYWLYVRTL